MGKLRRAANECGNVFFRCWRKVNWLTLGNLFFLFGSVLWLVSPVFCLTGFEAQCSITGDFEKLAVARSYVSNLSCSRRRCELSLPS
jgi:hypothetical protein